MYYIKFSVKYQGSGMTNTVIIKANNSTAALAQKYAESVVRGWQNIIAAEVIGTTTREIQLQKFVVVVKLFFAKDAPQKRSVFVTEENEEQAALLADEMIQELPDWKEYELISIKQAK